MAGLMITRRLFIAASASTSAGALAAPSAGRCPPPTASHLFIDLPRVSVAPDVALIFTAGYVRPGKFPAAYVRDSDQSPMSKAGRDVLSRLAAFDPDPARRRIATEQIVALESRIRVRTADGTWFTLNESAPVAGHFGAVGDGTYDEASGAFGGTDDTVAVQALIDWTLFWRQVDGGTISLGAGSFRLTRTLYVGRNTDYHSVSLRGEGMAYTPTFAGTRLLIDHTTGPAIALTGTAIGGVANLSCFGRLRRHIRASKLGQPDQRPAMDDVQLASWSDPAEPGTAERRFSPYACIAVDPFRGARPRGGYDAAATPPAWLPANDHYGQAFSSTELAIEKVKADGFNVAFVIQPSESDGNGDFIRFRDCAVTACARAWSVGNSQSRAMEIATCTVSNCHTVITTSAHGARNGSLRSKISHLSVGNSINLIDFGNALAVVGPVLFANLYCEGLYRLGHLAAGTSADSSLAFEDGQLGFDLIERRGPPRYILGTRLNTGYGPGGAIGRIRFTRCRFSNFGTLLTLMTRGLALTDCLIDPVNAGAMSAAARGAVDALAGGLVTATLAVPVAADFRHARAVGASDIIAFTPSGTVYADRARRVSLDKSAFVNARLSADRLTFTVASPGNVAPAAGDVLLDLTSGLVLFVDQAARTPTGQWNLGAVVQNSGEPADAPFDVNDGQVILAGPSDRPSRP